MGMMAVVSRLWGRRVRFWVSKVWSSLSMQCFDVEKVLQVSMVRANVTY
jgi:hypothetical protein